MALCVWGVLFKALTQTLQTPSVEQDFAEQQGVLDRVNVELEVRLGCRGPGDEMGAAWAS